MNAWNPGAPTVREDYGVSDGQVMVNVWITWRKLGESDERVHKAMWTTATVAAINSEAWAKDLARKEVYSSMVAHWHDIVVIAVSYTEPQEGDDK